MINIPLIYPVRPMYEKPHLKSLSHNLHPLMAITSCNNECQDYCDNGCNNGCKRGCFV